MAGLFAGFPHSINRNVRITCSTCDYGSPVDVGLAHAAVVAQNNVLDPIKGHSDPGSLSDMDGKQRPRKCANSLSCLSVP